MKRTSIVLSLACLALISSCGGGDDTVRPEGPILSVGEALSLVVDQFFVNGGLEDEYADEGEFSIYVRDTATGQDMACLTPEDGMFKLSRAGLYSGGLSIPFREVEGTHPAESAAIELVFVEQDGDGCPKPIAPEDDIVGTSRAISFDGLLGRRIWATNGLAAAVLRYAGDPPGDVEAMAPSLADGLSIDRLSFPGGGEESQYYLFAEKMEGGRVVAQCQIDEALLGKIHYGGFTYAALGFPFACFDPADPAFARTTVKVGLYVQRDAGPELVGETETQTIGDLIGEKVPFTNGSGSIAFRGVVAGPLSAPDVRLGDLEQLVVSAMDYTTPPSSAPHLEVHVVDAQAGYLIACAGADQGLTGIGAPGDHQGLTARFVAADGQEELFGWEGVVIQLVDRVDGLACPALPTSQPTVMATTYVASADGLASQAIAFEEGKGRITLIIP